MCSTKHIAIYFSINLDKYDKLETGQKFLKISQSSVVLLKSGLTTADLNATENYAVEKVKLIIRTITSIHR